MLDKFTFGKTPAAIYLVEHLNVRSNTKEIRKVSAFINSARQILTQAVDANVADIITVKTLYFIVDALSMKVKDIDIAPLGIDQLTFNLMTNIIIGEIKSIKRRATKVTRINREQVRIKDQHPSNSIEVRNGDMFKYATIINTVFLPTVSVNSVSDPTDIDVLIDRSKRKLQRLGKPDTLY